MKNEKIICYLPIEVLSRELDAKIYFAVQLIKNGYSCVVIGKKYGVRKHMQLQYNPFIYFDKGISYGKINRYQAIRKKGGVTVEIPEEGGVYGDMFEGTLNPYKGNCIEYVEGNCVWGEAQRKLILENINNADENKVIATGYPSFDLLQSDLREYYRKLSDFQNHSQKEHILINTNFACYNGKINFQESALINKKASEYLYNEKMLEKYNIQYSYEEKVYFCFIKMIKTLSAKLPNEKIIIRPHPVEKIESYKELFKSTRNVHIIKDGSVRQWIINSKAVIHHDCTTGIESYLMGKPTISYVPLNDIDNLACSLPILVSEVVNEVESLLSIIKSINKGIGFKYSQPVKERMSIIEPIIANTDSKATDRILKFIDANKDSWFGSMVYKERSFHRFRLAYFRYLEKIKRLLKSLIKTRRIGNIEKYHHEKFKGIHLAEIKHRIDILRWLDPTIPSIGVEELFDSTFLLKKDYQDGIR